MSGGHPPPRVEQSPYNLLERWVEADLVACCRELDMASLPCAQGALTGKYLGGRPAGSRGATTGGLDHLGPRPRAVRAYVTLCDKRSGDPAVAVAWVVQRAGVRAVFGARTERQLRPFLGAADACPGRGVLRQLDGSFARRDGQCCAACSRSCGLEPIVASVRDVCAARRQDDASPAPNSARRVRLIDSRCSPAARHGRLDLPRRRDQRDAQRRRDVGRGG